MAARPGLAWETLPEGWTDRGASGLRAANFSVSGPEGGIADLSVIPLPGMGGSDLDLVNLWRAQLNLPPIALSELADHTEEIVIARQPVKLFTIVAAGPSEGPAAGNQILVAALRREGFTWFFKLAGDAATVAANRDKLGVFLANVQFSQSSSAPSIAQAGPSPGSAPQPEWQVPPGWQAVASPPMVLSKWTAGSGDSRDSADITVSVFPGETGGLVANLNRWRAQVGLSPSPEQDLLALADNLDVLGGKATLADFTGSNPESGDPARMIAAIVRRGGWSWFYKLVGPPEAVAAQRDAFLKFVQTVQYPPRS
jgi:hypothetical protein